MTTAMQLPTDQKFGGFVAGIFGLLANFGFIGTIERNLNLRKLGDP